MNVGGLGGVTGSLTYLSEEGLAELVTERTAQGWGACF